MYVVYSQFLKAEKISKMLHDLSKSKDGMSAMRICSFEVNKLFRCISISRTYSGHSLGRWVIVSIFLQQKLGRYGHIEGQQNSVVSQSRVSRSQQRVTRSPQRISRYSVRVSRESVEVSRSQQKSVEVSRESVESQQRISRESIEFS